jgi:hypothetical protein
MITNYTSFCLSFEMLGCLCCQYLKYKKKIINQVQWYFSYMNRIDLFTNVYYVIADK